MPPSNQIMPYLPQLRRYARALTGSQRSGDDFVAATLSALIEDREVLELSLPPKIALYRVFHAIWTSGRMEIALGDEVGDAAQAQMRLQALTPMSRQALLLTTIEGFTRSEAAQVLGAELTEIDALVSEARAEITRQSQARVLIIEDETVIAMDLADIVSALGHIVVATAVTAERAVADAMAHKPDLVLADVQLADGSSGLDAVQRILSQVSIPVIFVTAFPERLLTGERPEPTYLVSKPYAEDAVRAIVSQVLFFNPKAPPP